MISQHGSNLGASDWLSIECIGDVAAAGTLMMVGSTWCEGSVGDAVEQSVVELSVAHRSEYLFGMDTSN